MVYSDVDGGGMSLANSMKALLAKLGEPVTFTRTTADTFDPDTGAYTPGATTTFTGFATAEQYNSSEIDGTTVMRGDLKITVSKTDQRPVVGDTVLFDSQICRVMDVYPVRMSGADVVYVLQGRV